MILKEIDGKKYIVLDRQENIEPVYFTNIQKLILKYEKNLELFYWFIWFCVLGIIIGNVVRFILIKKNKK